LNPEKKKQRPKKNDSHDVHAKSDLLVGEQGM
jgi:hypothetical protein